jgi:hypothetical protein
VINWIIILILVVVGILAIKLNHLKHRSSILIIVIVALFFYASVTFIATKNNLSMDSYDGFVDTMKAYGGWLANGFQNIRVLTGNAIHMDWTSTNGTFFGNSNNTVATSSKPSLYKSGQASVKFANK